MMDHGYVKNVATNVLNVKTSLKTVDYVLNQELMNQIVSAHPECGTMKEYVKTVVTNVKYVKILQMTVLIQIVLVTESEMIVHVLIISTTMDFLLIVSNVDVNVLTAQLTDAHLAQEPELQNLSVHAQQDIMKPLPTMLVMQNVTILVDQMMELVHHVNTIVKPVPTEILVPHVN